MSQMSQVTSLQTMLTLRRLRQLIAEIYAAQKLKRSLHGVLHAVAGDHAAAAMLEQAIIWQSVVNRKRCVDGWWWKDAREWQAEVGLTRRDVERGRKLLAGVLEHCVKRLRDGRTMSHYRVNFGKLIDALAQAVQTTVEALLGRLTSIVQSEHSRMYRADNPAMHDADNSESTGATIPNAQTEQRGMAAADKESSVYKDLSSVEQSSENTTSAGVVVEDDDEPTVIEKIFAVKAENAETPDEPITPPPTPSPALATWRKVKTLLDLQMDRHIFQTWLKDAWLVRSEVVEGAPVYVLGVPNIHALEYCNTRLRRQIWRAFTTITERQDIDVRFELAVGADPVEQDAEPFTLLQHMSERSTEAPGMLNAAQMYARYFSEPSPDEIEQLRKYERMYPVDVVRRAIQATANKPRQQVASPVAYIGGVLARSALASM